MAARGTRMTVRVPADYVFTRDACSYGYFLLAPNHWDPESLTMTRIVELEQGPARLGIRQPVPSSSGAFEALTTGKSLRAHRKATRGQPLIVQSDRILSRDEQKAARDQISRMLRLDEDDATLKSFHKLDPRWKRSGRGRLFRSPTLFEDVIKTVTSCNVQWPSTVHMNVRLCDVVGKGGAFPSAEKLARTRASTLRGRCRVGYRDARIVELSRMFARGEIDEQWMCDPETSDSELFDFLKTLPGIGPYASANIMQLLGRYSRLPLDTESVRHGKSVLGFTGKDPQIMKRVHKHFEPFGDHAFRSYWFEMWEFYETKAGPSETWKPREVASAFTASNLK